MSVFLVVISSNLVCIQANKDLGCQKILWGQTGECQSHMVLAIVPTVAVIQHSK